MPTMQDPLAENKAAVQSFLGVVDQLTATWTTPRAPGKWSPSQVTEHVSRAFDESTKVCAAQAAHFPALPALIRPLARGLLFNRVVKKGTFPKAKTNRPMDPGTGPPTPAEGRSRLEGAVAAFEKQVRSMPPEATVSSLTFGNVKVSDWVAFQAAHVRHHQAQLRPWS